MRALRIIDTGLKPARWNVAMTAALVELHSKGGAGDLVRFHRYPPCVLIGATQKAERVADLEHCRRSGIDLVRRITGGGAVYMSPAMLAWDVIVDCRAFGGPLDALTRRICGGIAAGLSRLGVSRHRRRAPILLHGIVAGSPALHQSLASDRPMRRAGRRSAAQG
jgi:lipoate-protein ligase A